MRYRAFSLVLGVLFLGGMAAPAFAQFDKVFDASGRPSPGMVTEVSSADVSLEANGSVRKFPANEVKRVVYNDEPEGLNEARDSISHDNFEQAVDELSKIDATKVSRALVKQDLAFYKAYAASQLALRGGGDKKAAYGEMGAFIAQAGGRNSFHFYEAAQVMGDLAAAQGDLVRATSAYGALSKAPFPEVVMLGLGLEAQALRLQDKYAESLAKYEEVLRNNASTPEALKQRQVALLGKAVCLAGGGKPDEGMALVEDVLKKADPAKDPALMGRAYNAQGVCLAKTNKTKDAILAFLHTEVMYFQDPDVHAEALYNLARLWTAINKSDRALQATQTLKQRYAGTVWEAKK